MTLDYPRALGPGVRELIGDDDLTEIRSDDDVALLRTRTSRDLLVLHQRPPDVVGVLDEADRLAWLTGRGPAPAVIASGRADEGDEATVVQFAAAATPAVDGHPLGPEALIAALASGLRALHELDVAQCPFDAGPDALRREVEHRLSRDLVAVATEGPYAGRSPTDLAAVHDGLQAELGDVAGDAVFIHARLDGNRVWFDPAGGVTFTGWRRSGVGDRHIDLAAASAILATVHGPALVAPFFDAYGLDDVDPRRLDAAQLVVHLLS